MPADLGAPRLSAPLQQEKFFEPDRLSVQKDSAPTQQVLEPQLAVTHDVREDEVGDGHMQTRHKVHGEAGGKLNLFGDASLSAVAKIPVYTYDVVGSPTSNEGVGNSDLLKNPGRMSWRTELGLPLGKGVNLNIFYDNILFPGKSERPGVDDREQKFGTRFIFRFK